MIVYILKDGLGNQLFEYAYAKKLQEKGVDKQIVFCTFLYNLKNFSLGGTRHCSLQHFNLSNDVVILHGVRNLFYFVRFMFRLMVIYKKDFISWFLKGKRVSRKGVYAEDCRRGLYISESSFDVPEYIHSEKRIKYVFGNYEGVGVLPANIEALRNELQIKTQATDSNKTMLGKISSCESVCVHIRRGDYLNKGNEWLQVCDYEYYRRAIERIKRQIANPIFFIFSNTHDDIEWIKQNYKFDADLFYVDLSNSDYEELRLMSACKHFIISNSSFSWWASLLSTSNNKKVIAPSKWSSREDQSEAMFRDEFEKC